MIFKLFKFFIFLVFPLFAGCSKIEKNAEVSDFSNEIRRYNNLKKIALENPSLKDSVLREIYLVSNDSIKQNFVFDIAYEFYIMNDSVNFRFWNKSSYLLSQKLKDTSRIAEAEWDLGNFFYRNNYLDSSYVFYNRAFRNYEKAGDDFQAGRMLLNLGKLQKNIKDFVGSEVTIIRAIKKLKPLQENAQLYSAYNSLGIINNELEKYSESLNYHRKALDYEQYLNDPILRASSYNNIGVVERNRGRHRRAILNYKEALKTDSLLEKNSRLYAMLIDNNAYSHLKIGDTIGVERSLYKALKIREEINHLSGILINRIHLGEFYIYKKDLKKAYEQFYYVSNTAQNNRLYSELLESLLFLTQIDTVNAGNYYSEYIIINDSLQKQERVIRDKFTRIRFETDEFIAQNEELSQQRKWMIFSFTGLVISLLSFFIIINQRSKNRELRLVKDQQKTNEDIYNLLIESQTKIEEGQEKEKKRISRELHDGILSQFFGVRLNLEFLNDKTDAASIEKRNGYIEHLKQLEKELRIVSHQLSEDFLSSEKSFLSIVQELLEQQEIIGSFKCNMMVQEEIEWDRLSPKLKINLYRIIQEAVHNINKYAGATEVKVIFSKIADELTLSIKDNGNGFKVESASNGIGISNMKERVMELNGTIIFQSHNSYGTNIEINIPIPPQNT
jgi:two-component system, NarL family, sensor kinase